MTNLRFRRPDYTQTIKKDLILDIPSLSDLKDFHCNSEDSVERSFSFDSAWEYDKNHELGLFYSIQISEKFGCEYETTIVLDNSNTIEIWFTGRKYWKSYVQYRTNDMKLNLHESVHAGKKKFKDLFRVKPGSSIGNDLDNVKIQEFINSYWDPIHDKLELLLNTINTTFNELKKRDS